MSEHKQWWAGKFCSRNTAAENAMLRKTQQVRKGRKKGNAQSNMQL
jgi:hypothetical protein